MGFILGFFKFIGNAEMLITELAQNLPQFVIVTVGVANQTSLVQAYDALIVEQRRFHVHCDDFGKEHVVRTEVENLFHHAFQIDWRLID